MLSTLRYNAFYATMFRFVREQTPSASCANAVCFVCSRRLLRVQTAFAAAADGDC